MNSITVANNGNSISPFAMVGGAGGRGPAEATSEHTPEAMSAWVVHFSLLDPGGQPLDQNHEFLNCFFNHAFTFQANPHANVAASLAIGRQ